MSIFFLKWWRGSDWSEFCQALFQRFRKDLGFLDFFATPISNLRELVDNRIFAWVCFYKFLYAMGALCYFALKQQSFIKWNHKFHQPMCWATENLTPSNFPLLDEEMVSVWANEAMCNFPVRFLRHWFSPRTTSLRPPMLKAMWSATHRCSDRWGCFRFGTGRSDVVWHWYEVLSYDVSWYDMVWYDSGVCVCVFSQCSTFMSWSWRCVFRSIEDYEVLFWDGIWEQLSANRTSESGCRLSWDLGLFNRF